MRRWAAALLLGAALSAAGPAGAADSAVEQAKMLFNAGAQAYSNGDFRGAIQAFGEAYKLAPRPAILFSMAQAHRRQYVLDQKPADLRRAIALYRDYVAQVPQGGRRADAAQALAELEPAATRLGITETGDPAQAPEIQVQTRVAVSCPTPGAMVSIDGGKPVPAGGMTEVEPGKHKVRITAEGHFDQEREIDAKKGGVFPVDVTLVERPAKVTVLAPTGATISVDGRPAGVAPLAAPLSLSAGNHFITIAMSGHRTFSEELKLRRGEEKKLQANLERTGQRVVAYGMWIAGAAAAGIGVAGTLIAVGHQNKAQQVLDEQANQNITPSRRDELDVEIARRDEWRGVALLGYTAGAALGLTGLLLYTFDTPVVGTGPVPPDDNKPGAPSPKSTDTMVEVAVTPILSPGLAFGSLVGRF